MPLNLSPVMQRPIIPADLAAAIERVGKDRASMSATTHVMTRVTMKSSGGEEGCSISWTFNRCRTPAFKSLCAATISRFYRACCGRAGEAFPYFRTLSGLKRKNSAVCPLVSRRRGIVRGCNIL
jgi:hypothetical protein